MSGVRMASVGVSISHPTFLRTHLASLGQLFCTRARGLEVIGDLHGDAVGGLEQRPEGGEVGLGTAVGDQDVVARGVWVEERDAVAQRLGAVGLWTTNDLR